MIRVRAAKQDSFGASHRENVDTPPLEGNCGDTRGIPSVTDSNGAFSNPVLVLGAECPGERGQHALHIQ